MDRNLKIELVTPFVREDRKRGASASVVSTDTSLALIINLAPTISIFPAATRPLCSLS